MSCLVELNPGLGLWIVTKEDEALVISNQIFKHLGTKEKDEALQSYLSIAGLLITDSIHKEENAFIY